MPSFNFLLEPLARTWAFFDRRRGLAVVLTAIVVLVLGTATPVVHRPPILTVIVDGVTSGFMRVFSEPLRVTRFFTDTEPTGRTMRLELELAALREMERENLRLRRMIDYEATPEYQVFPGRVMGLDLDPLSGMAWINVGSEAGIRAEIPVMTVDGLVGVVDRVWQDRARVRLLRNENTPVSVRNTRSRALGVLTWDPGAGRLRVSNVPFQADMAVGDTLISSGLGGVFPPGLPVGTVTRVADPPERLLKEVLVDPFGAFYRLEEVFVLLAREGPPAPDGGRETGEEQ